MNVIESYNRRKEMYEKLEAKLTKQYNYTAALRLFVFLFSAVLIIYFYKMKLYFMEVSIIFIFLILYGVLINIQNKIRYHKKLCLNIIGINKDSIERVQGNWTDFTDNGEEFKNELHQYSYDLDIFGKGSLFQYINCTVTYTGKQILRKTLAKADYIPKEIYDRQKAVIELSKKIWWRQRFQSDGKIHISNMKSPEELIKWAKETSRFNSDKSPLNLIRYIPLVTIFILILYFSLHLIPAYIPLVLVTFQVFLVYYKKTKRVQYLELINLYKKDILTYRNLINNIEKAEFHCSYLKNLKSSLYDSKGCSSTDQINALVKLSTLISDRNNFFYIVLNILTLWDYQCMFALDKWKTVSGSKINIWLNVIGEMESLCSISILEHDNADWTMPKFEEDRLFIYGKNIGHPLITQNRVCNDLKIGEREKIILVTGSNMSGKSTLLRTVGVNLVLAYAGSPVCAESFCCSKMDIYTCMRTSDNIEENISSFYAELLKIKKIIKAVNENKKVLFLLDEIFKGTNSYDRHTGAKMLLNKLSKKNAIGFVSTHDLELGDMENENNKIKNYHFEEYYRNNKIFFDYKLKRGVSTTTNAIYLMKLAGIDTL